MRGQNPGGAEGGTHTFISLAEALGKTNKRAAAGWELLFPLFPIITAAKGEKSIPVAWRGWREPCPVPRSTRDECPLLWGVTAVLGDGDGARSPGEGCGLPRAGIHGAVPPAGARGEVFLVIDTQSPAIDGARGGDASALGWLGTPGNKRRGIHGGPPLHTHRHAALAAAAWFPTGAKCLLPLPGIAKCPRHGATDQLN